MRNISPFSLFPLPLPSSLFLTQYLYPFRLPPLFSLTLSHPFFFLLPTSLPVFSIHALIVFSCNFQYSITVMGKWNLVFFLSHIALNIHEVLAYWANYLKPGIKEYFQTLVTMNFWRNFRLYAKSFLNLARILDTVSSSTWHNTTARLRLVSYLSHSFFLSSPLISSLLSSITTLPSLLFPSPFPIHSLPFSTSPFPLSHPLSSLHSLF